MTRLVTFIDVDNDIADARQKSVSARHEAVMGNGRRVLLLDDRGWSSSFGAASVEDAPDGVSRRESMPDIWAMTSVEDIVATARVVVGPDEPSGVRTHEDMEADH